MCVLAELRRTKAAMRSPIPIEPMHSFSYVHHRQRHMARGRVRTYDNGVSPDGTHLVNLCMQLGLQLKFDIGELFYDQLKAVESKRPLTSNT